MPGATVTIELHQRDKDGCVARVTIRNESRRNALTAVLMTHLTSAFRDLAANENLRAAVLTGAGEKAFSGGVDIEEMGSLPPSEAREFITRLHSVCQSIRDLPVPVIARVQGYALGGAMEVIASCDLRIAGESARFGMPEVRLGIPSVIEAALLPHLVGWGWTRRLLLLGEVIPAQEALACGFVERVVPDSKLNQAVEEWLEMLLSAGPRAIRQQKALIRKWEDASVDQAIEMGIDAFQAAYEAGEPQRMMRAFLQARRRHSSPANENSE
jgi:enoyl-CoA hydratase/carnithine racemase